MKIRLVLAAAAVLLLSLVTVGPASAQYTGGNPPAAGPVANPRVQVQGAPSPVRAQVQGAPSPVRAQVQGTPSPVRVQVRATPAAVRAQTATATRRLAVTGTDIAQMVLIGGAFVVGGAVLVRQSRRRYL